MSHPSQERIPVCPHHRKRFQKRGVSKGGKVVAFFWICPVLGCTERKHVLGRAKA